MCYSSLAFLIDLLNHSLLNFEWRPIMNILIKAGTYWFSLLYLGHVTHLYCGMTCCLQFWKNQKGWHREDDMVDNVPAPDLWNLFSLQLSYILPYICSKVCWFWLSFDFCVLITCIPFCSRWHYKLWCHFSYLLSWEHNIFWIISV